MGVIRKRNPQTGEWEIFGSTEAIDINLIDASGKFESKNVEGALRELSDKVDDTTSFISAHSEALSYHAQALAQHQKDIEWIKENGVGGDVNIVPTITSNFEAEVVGKNQEVKIPIFFASPNLGEGTCYVSIDNIEVMSIPNITQGNNTINIGVMPNLHNHVAIYVKDRAGLLSNQLEWDIIAGGIELSIDFDSTADYTVTDVVYMQFNINTTSKDPIIMHMTIDYDAYDIECFNGFNEYTFPSMGVGIHQISFFIDSGVYSTDVIKYNIVILDSNALYVSSTFEVGSQYEQGHPITIPYRISKASSETFTVNLYLGNNLYKTLSSTAGSYTWTLTDAPLGENTVRIEALSSYGEHEFIDLSFVVVEAAYEPLQTVTSGMSYRLNAKGRTNQDIDRENPIDDSGNNVTTVLHGFNFFTNGWINDELVCDSNAYVEIDLFPYMDNAIYGSTIEIQFTGIDIGLNNARIFDYTDVETPYKGIYIDLEQSELKSLANTGTVNIDKDVETTLSFVIDRKNKFGKIFIDGVCSRAFFLSDSGAGTSATREDFTHSQKMYINGLKGKSNFGACKIKDLRVYNRVLTDDEIVKNYIAQETDLEKQKELYDFNFNNKTLPVIRMYGNTENMTLETAVTMRIKYDSPDEERYGQSFDLPYCQVNWQGTSSLQYVLKNFTARLRDSNMAVYEYTPYPNGVKEDVYCFKADYMESTHSRNVGIAKFVNECLYDTKTPVQLKDGKIRNAVNGFPCVLYINDSLQGVYNFNLDRYSTKSFGYTDNTTLVYEVSANSDTTAGAFYKWSASSGKDELSYYKSDFECLYPPTRAAGNDNMTELIRLIEWVNDSSDEDFKDNIGNYFNLEYLLRYYLFVLVFGAVDSLGKNMKLATFDGLVWYPQVYDADTTIGLDNTGFLKFDMDIEMGDVGVFNTTGSRLWQRIVLLFQAELKQQYTLMRQDRFTVDNIMKYIYEEQIAKIPATYYNKDMQTKYLNFGSSYLYALHGSGEHHIKRWIRERITYIDSLLGYMVDFDKDKITLRSSKLGYVYIDIQTYIPMYISVKWRDEANNTGLQTKRVGRGETVRFEYNMPTATDQEILVYAGYYLKSLGDLSNLEPTSMLIANAKRLTQITCHSPNLINTDLSQCTLLQHIDLSNSTALGTGIGAQPILNIQNCTYLRTCDCRNTQLTAIYTMPSGGNLEEIYYPSSTQTVQVTNQTYLKVLGLPLGDARCQNLAEVDIQNCNNISIMHYPYNNSDGLDFTVFKYVQALNITNSLDSLRLMAFDGFSKLMSINLNSMPYLEYINFTDMLKNNEVSTLSNIKITDCPQVTSIAFNVTDNNHKVEFAEGCKIDLGGLHNVTSIESNTSIKGLDTLIIPTSTKELKFTSEFSNEPCEIKSIWSSTANHAHDGFVGIDFKDIELTYLDMAKLLITNAINFNIAPTIQNPNLNTYRDGVNQPYFTPTGTMDITDYTGDFRSLFKGIDTSKLKVTYGDAIYDLVINIESLFEGAIVYKDSINLKQIMMKFPNATVWDKLFKNASIDFDTDYIIIPKNRPMSLISMYEGTDITKDVELPSNVSNVNSMFKNCINLKSYVNNWHRQFDNLKDITNCYTGSGNDMIVPRAWGGQGWIAETTSKIRVTIPEDNYSFTLLSDISNILGEGNIDWGDGSDVQSIIRNPFHIYESAGVYTITGNFTFGGSEPSQSIKDCLKEVVFVPTDILPDMSYMFYECTRVESIDLSNIKSNCITNMHSMFSKCSSLKAINFGNLDTSQVTDMGSLFYNCTSLQTVYLDKLSTSSVIDMSDMFRGTTLQTLDLLNFDTSKVSNMSGMFADCSRLSYLNLDNFTTSNVNNMSYMFQNCSSILSLDLSSFDTVNVQNMSHMFDGCSSLTNLKQSFNTSKVTNMQYLFADCTKLKNIDLNNFNTLRVEDMQYMFYRCNSLQTLNISTLNTTNITSLDYMFYECSSLKSLNISTFQTNKVTSMNHTFNYCSSLTSLTLGNIDTSKVESMHSLFANCTSLENLDLLSLNTSNVTNMYGMFQNCSSLKTINLESFDVSKVQNMSYMFNNCRGFIGLDLSNFVTTNLEDMLCMFRDCTNLRFLDIACFNTNKVQSIDYAFHNCNSLQTIYLHKSDDATISSFVGLLPVMSAKSSGDIVVPKYTSEFNEKYWFSRVAILKDTDILVDDRVERIMIEITSENYNTRTQEVLEAFPNVVDYKLADDNSFNAFPDLGESWRNKVVTLSFKFNTFKNILSLYCAFEIYKSLTSFYGNELNIGKVTTIYQIFHGCTSLQSLDVSTWDTSSVTNMYYTFHSCKSLQSLDVSNWDTSQVTNMQGTFSTCSSLQSLDLSNWDTSSVTNMQYTFYNCNSLQSLDVSNWDTSSVTNMYATFSDCSSLQSLDLSNWNMSKAKNMQYTFYHCTSLQSLDVSDWDTSQVTNMDSTFNGCESLQSLDLNNWDISQVTNMYQTFANCTSLQSLDLSNWDTSSVKDMYAIFFRCTSLQSLDVSNWDTSSVMRMDYAFQYCSSLQSLDVSNWNTSLVEGLRAVFYLCSSLQSLDLSNWDTSSVTSMQSTFTYCSSLQSLDLSTWNTSQVTSMLDTFNNCSSLQSLDLSNWDTSSVTNTQHIFLNCPKLTTVSLRYSSIDTQNTIIPLLPTRTSSNVGNIWIETTTDDIVSQAYAKYWHITTQGYLVAKYTTTDRYRYPTFNSGFFYTSQLYEENDGQYVVGIISAQDIQSISFAGQTSLISVDRLMITDKCRSFTFDGCSNVSYINSTNWNTSSVTTMYVTFNNCTSLQSLDVSNWDTSSLTNMLHTFQGCSSLQSLDVSNWDTSKVTNMYYAFHTCSSLQSLDVSKWDTSSVTTMQGLFFDCSSLRTLDVSNWDTSQVINMESIFLGCKSLQSLDVSNWDTSKVTTMSHIFYNCRTLQSLDLSNWDTSSLTNMYNTFADCLSLQSLDLSNWDTSSVTNMNSTFAYCHALQTLDISNWDTSQVTTMYSLFKECKSLQSLDVSNWDTSQVTTMQQTFSGCSSLQSLDISNWDTSSLKTMQSTFYNCKSLQSLDLSNWDTSKVTSLQGTFYDCSSLQSLDVSNLDTSQVTTMEYTFYNCPKLNLIYCNYPNTIKTLSSVLPTKSLTSYGTVEGFNLKSIVDDATLASKYWRVETYDTLVAYKYDTLINEDSIPYMDITEDDYRVWDSYRSGDFIKDEEGNITKAIRTRYLASNEVKPTVIRFGTGVIEDKNDFSISPTTEATSSIVEILEVNADTLSDVTFMYRKCINLSKVNMLSIGSSKSLLHIFSDCTSLQSLDVSNWDTSKVKGMAYIFYNCIKLQSLDISNWDTSKVTNMTATFYNCRTLQSLDPREWKTDSVTTIQSIFSGCSSLQSLDLSNWDTSQVTNMYGTFAYCSSLQSLDVSNWDTSQVTRTEQAIYYCPALREIRCNNLDTINRFASLLPTRTSNNKGIVYSSIDLDNTQIDSETLNLKYWCYTESYYLVTKSYDNNDYNSMQLDTDCIIRPLVQGNMVSNIVSQRDTYTSTDKSFQGCIAETVFIPKGGIVRPIIKGNTIIVKDANGTKEFRHSFKDNKVRIIITNNPYTAKK